MVSGACGALSRRGLPRAQTIFGQMSTTVVYFFNFAVFKARLRWYHHTIVGAILALNLGTAWGGGFESSERGLVLALWCFLFMANAVGSGLANNFVEALLAAAEVRGEGGSRAGGGEQHVMAGGYTLEEYILGVNAAAGVFVHARAQKHSRAQLPSCVLLPS